MASAAGRCQRMAFSCWSKSLSARTGTKNSASLSSSLKTTGQSHLHVGQVRTNSIRCPLLAPTTRTQSVPSTSTTSTSTCRTTHSLSSNNNHNASRRGLFQQNQQQQQQRRQYSKNTIGMIAHTAQVAWDCHEPTYTPSLPKILHLLRPHALDCAADGDGEEDDDGM